MTVIIFLQTVHSSHTNLLLLLSYQPKNCVIRLVVYQWVGVDKEMHKDKTNEHILGGAKLSHDMIQTHIWT